MRAEAGHPFNKLLRLAQTGRKTKIMPKGKLTMRKASIEQFPHGILFCFPI
jgi:hypothetical protein